MIFFLKKNEYRAIYSSPECRHLCSAHLNLAFHVWNTDRGGSVGGEWERLFECKWWKGERFRQTENSQTCPLRSSLTGAYVINRSYNYQTSGHQHYSAAHAPHLRTWSLTQLLAVLKRRRRQTCDPAGVTPEVLVLRCCRNVPHLHRRVSATRGEVEEEGTRDVNLEWGMSDENKLK